MAKIFGTTNTISGIKYDSPTDIPNLQLWLDAADSSRTTLGVAGFRDWSWYFNGLTQVRVDHTPALTFGNKNFHLSFWLYLSELTSQGYLFWKAANSAQVENFILYKNGGTLKFWAEFTDAGAGWSQNNVSAGSLNIGWQFIEVVRNGSPLNIYINGVSTYAGTFTTLSLRDTTLGPINIGLMYTSGGAIIGSLNNALISNLRLRIGDVSGYSGDSTVPLPLSASTTELQLFTRGNSLIDYSPTPKTVYINGGTSYPVSPNVVTTWTDKSPFNASATVPSNNFSTVPILLSSEINGLNVLNFDGSNDFLTLNRTIPISGNYSSFFVYRRPASDIYSISLGNFQDYSTPILHWNSNQLFGGNTYTNLNTPAPTGVLVASTRKDQSFYLNRTRYNVIGWGTTTTPVSTVGRAWGLSHHSDAMGEIILTNTMLPDWELDFVNSRLMVKWGIT